MSIYLYVCISIYIFSCPQQLNRWPCHSLTNSVTHSLLLLTLQSDPRELWPLTFDQSDEETWIHDNLCYLTINCDTGQHSQFLRCFLHGHCSWLNFLHTIYIKFVQKMASSTLFLVFPTAFLAFCQMSIRFRGLRHQIKECFLEMNLYVFAFWR